MYPIPPHISPLENSHDKYAIKVLKNETVVGHVPREISPYCCYALNSGGKMKATVCGRRENKRGGGPMQLLTERTR